MTSTVATTPDSTHPWMNLDPVQLDVSEPPSETDRGAGLATGLRILRGLGALVLVASVSPFLVQQWSAGSDVARYLTLLGYSVLVGAAGIFCSLRLQENKGARTFLGVALLSLPVHGIVLGALVYSRFSLDGALRQLPAIATWQAPSAGAAVALVGAALLVLAPMMWMAILTLARPRARVLFPALLAANASLLIPLREPTLIAPLVFVLALALVRLDLRLRRYAAMETWEGRFVRLVLAAPLMLLVGRSVWLYEPSSLFFGTLFAVVAGGLFLAAPAAPANRRGTLEALAAVPAGTAWLLWTRPIANAFSVSAADDVLLVGLPLAAAAAWVGAKFTSKTGLAYRYGAAIFGLATVLLSLAISPSVLGSLLCLAIGIVAVVYACLGGHRLIFATGLLGVGVGLALQLRYAAQLFAWSRWGALAVLGIATILAASWLERNQGQVALRFEAFKRRMS